MLFDHVSIPINEFNITLFFSTTYNNIALPIIEECITPTIEDYVIAILLHPDLAPSIVPQICDYHHD
jgi:hypothetical protein